MTGMPVRDFSVRFKWLATWLSLLAVCSALLGPASVLAQEMRTGTWTGLCSAGMATAHDGQAPDGEGGHCDLCALPGLGAELPQVQAWTAQPAAPAQLPWRFARLGEADSAHPAIRGPPVLS